VFKTMALDRLDIEKKDFPIGRRGYEPEAVDSHLRRVADAYESAESSAGAASPGPSSLAAAASEQVRTIVEAAESSAAEIRRQADDEARTTLDEAGRDASRTRAVAESEAREHVERVSEATAVMLQRVDAMETEFGALLETLRTGANRLSADLTLLKGNMGELETAAEPGAHAVAPTSEPVVMEAVADEPADEAYDESAAPAPAPAAPIADSEGARMVALNMALDGRPREETAAYLEENFGLGDTSALLDEVYARIS
jgi:DivIVA domain-containing protein